jgi:integrase
MTTDLEQRFRSKITKDDGGHWGWSGATTSKGVGVMKVDGKLRLAKHVAWYLTHGEWPAELEPVCGNRDCLRPDHFRQQLPASKATAKPRRAAGSGNITLQTSGRMRIRVSTARDPVTGKRRQISKTMPAGSSRRKVEEEAARLRTEVAEGQHRSTSRTLGELLDRWWEIKQREIAGTTANNYGSSRRYLEPLRPVPITKLTTEMIETFYNQLRTAGSVRDGKGLSKSSVRNVHCVLNGALQTGKRWGWLRTNPAAGVEIVAGDPRRQVRISEGQIRDLVNKARELEGEPFELLIRLAAVAGPRRGELHALRFSDVDWEGHRLEVVRNYVKIVGGWAEKPTTKTGRSRWVDLDDITMGILRAQQLRLAEIGRLLDSPIADDAFIFSDDGREPWNPNTSLRRFQVLCGLVGLPPETRMHDLRHFMVTTLFEHKVPAKQITGRSGHARTSTAVDIYYGAAESQREAAEVMGGVLDDTAASQPSGARRRARQVKRLR